jgi:hypothetical protein
MHTTEGRKSLLVPLPLFVFGLHQKLFPLRHSAVSKASTTLNDRMGKVGILHVDCHNVGGL